MQKSIYINLPVKDLAKSITFFSNLGFSFNPQFTDENAACLVIGDNIYAMLLREDYFKTFTKKELVDAAKSSETIIAISMDSREAVNNIVNKALAVGGSKSRDPEDHGWMYGWSFQDPDSHIWEVLYMDPKGPPDLI